MKNSRRSFMKSVVLGLGAIAVAPVIKLQSAFAALVSKTDTMVVALGYVENVSAFKGKAVPPTFKKGSNCANCNFYPDAKAKQAKCPLIQGGEVLATGWCRSWVKRA
jgi:hypothetical protein